MYNITELSEMTSDQLRTVAESLSLKKIDVNNPEALIYRILDQQAIVSAADASTEKRTRQTNTADKKRGRKKATTAEVSAEAEATATTESEPASESDSTANAQEATAGAKKRGRKKKSEIMATATQALADTVSQETEDKQDAEPADTSDAPAKEERRRRPRMSQMNIDPDAQPSELEKPVPMPMQQAPATPANFVEPEASAEEAPIVAEVVSAPEPAVVEQQEEATEQQSNGPRTFGKSDSMFGSFFPRSEGRKFVPRSQREKEEAAAKAAQAAEEAAKAAASAPITIGEPTANSQERPQQNPPGTGKKNKKKRNKNNVEAPATPQYNFDNILTATGVLEVAPEGCGFLRSSDYNYMPSPDDIFVTQQQIKQWGLRPGDVVTCTLNAPKDSDKYFPMNTVKSVNGRSPQYIRDRVQFEHMTPLFPNEKFDLTSGSTSNMSTRIVDMFAPIGKGQRALIVAPPKTGKTLLLKDIANAIAANHPETYIMILLIDERPEEVTDMMRSVNAEVIASTFDEPAERHVRISSIVLEKAKRMVESGHDVVILLDSITRLARAYNTVAPASGKILSGGVDASALQKPKRFFGAARNIENGGSLTIIATALTETSSRMDEVIFEEFKGTGNMELQLDRKLSNKRIFPAVDIVASSTRRDDLLLRPETLNRMWILRRFLSDRNSIEAMEFIQDRMQRTRDNDELLRTMGD